MDRRWVILDDVGAIALTVTPLGYAKFAEDEDLSVGLIAKRRKLTTDLVFVGDDYDVFLAIERNAQLRCKDTTIRRDWHCNGQWITYWTGVFSTGSGSWDFDNCTFTVRPDPLDGYTCIMRGMNRKVNVLKAPPVTATALVSVSLEWGGCLTPDPGCDQCFNTEVDGGGLPINGWELANITAVPEGFLGVYWREIINTICIDGTPVVPPGGGWTLLEDNCAINGTAKYVRSPTIAYAFGDAQLGTCVDGVAIPPSGSGCIWQQVYPCPSPCTTAGPYFICYDPAATEFDRARTLQGIANFLLQELGCDQTQMVSDLLEWNPPGDAPGYAAGVNYVNGSANDYNALVALQNSDAIDPGASNPATIGEMTLKDLFTLLSGARIFWAIDALGRVRVEHWIFWTTPIGLSLLNYSSANKSEPLQYVHLKAEVPRYERPKWTQAQGLDFIGADIEYTGPCVSTDGENDVREYNLSPFMTDITFIMTDPDAINKQGFTILATAFDGSLYNTIIGQGALSGNFVTNSPMSWANLEEAFWQHDRFLSAGIMNNVARDFLGFLPTIEQRNVVVKVCCDALGFVSTDRVMTALGKKLGGLNPLAAFVKRLEFDEATECFTLTLRYAY